MIKNMELDAWCPAMEQVDTQHFLDVTGMLVARMREHVDSGDQDLKTGR